MQAPTSATTSPNQHPRAHRTRAAALIVSALLAGALGVAAADAAKARIATVTLTKVAVQGENVTITGRVSLPASSIAERRHIELLVTLTDGKGHFERFTARLDASERFMARHTTHLRGALGLAISIRISGRAIGHALKRTVDVALPTSPDAGAGTNTGTGSGGGSGAAGPTGPAPGDTSPSPTEPQGPLDGTFELEPGAEVAGAITGSWFEMWTPGSATEASSPLPNGNSPFKNHDYAPLSPGTDGGLQTFEYQPAPKPPFEEPNGTGNSLADEIMKPQSFFGYDFSTVTEETDPQAGKPDPLAQILNNKGVLSGQVTAWAVGWNGQWFNQGTPKPEDTEPGRTTALSGTYDFATGDYTLEWESQISKGPFNGFVGSWHLEGTFVPES
jgi:hypothetical protein